MWGVPRLVTVQISRATALLLFSSIRVQIRARVNNVPVEAIAVDTASDVHAFIRSNPTLDAADIQPVPPESMHHLNSAAGSPQTNLGFIWFNLTLGEDTLLLVETFVFTQFRP